MRRFGFSIIVLATISCCVASLLAAVGDGSMANKSA